MMKIHSHGVASGKMLLKCIIEGCNTSPAFMPWTIMGVNIDPASRLRINVLEVKLFISIN